MIDILLPFIVVLLALAMVALVLVLRELAVVKRDVRWLRSLFGDALGKPDMIQSIASPRSGELHLPPGFEEMMNTPEIFTPDDDG